MGVFLDLYTLDFQGEIYQIYPMYLAASSHFFGSHTNHLGKIWQDIGWAAQIGTALGPFGSHRQKHRHWIYWIHVKSWYTKFNILMV
jgi:hypothetical protein